MKLLFFLTVHVVLASKLCENHVNFLQADIKLEGLPLNIVNEAINAGKRKNYTFIIVSNYEYIILQVPV